MAQIENIDEVMEKKFKKSLLSFMKLVDPECKFGFDTPLIEAWNALSLTEQRRLYLYLLYRKWRGEKLYNTPYEIVKNCHPYPTNWNGRPMLERLIKDGTPMVRAFFDIGFGIYTQDEAKVWEMTQKEPIKVLDDDDENGCDKQKTRERLGKD